MDCIPSHFLKEEGSDIISDVWLGPEGLQSNVELSGFTPVILKLSFMNQSADVLMNVVLYRTPKILIWNSEPYLFNKSQVILT